MIIFFLISFSFTIGYIFLLLHISDGWDKLDEIEIPTDYTPQIKASVIIATRNEEKNIAFCIESIYANNLSKNHYEIIVVDDHSEDNTIDIIHSRFPDVNLIKLESGHGKKAAIEKGVKASENDLCIVTDADCQAGNSWIKSHIWVYENQHTSFHAGPVISTFENSLVSAFQVLDFMSMSQIIGNGISRKDYFIANGANMAFDKEKYNNIGGMKSHMHISSGDDMFLINEISKINKQSIQYIKSPFTTVTTKSESSWHAFFRQRKRWAAKTRHLPKDKGYYIQVYVMLLHLVIITNFLLAPWTNGLSFFTGLLFLLLKGTIDYLFLSKSCRYYGIIKPLKYFIPAFLFYFIYIFYMAGNSLFTRHYSWKGRNVI